MNCGNESVDHRVEILMSDRWQNFQPHAVILELSWGYVMSAAVDGDFVSSAHETRSEVFRKSFEPAVTGRNASRSQNRNAHNLDSSSNLLVNLQRLLGRLSPVEGFSSSATFDAQLFAKDGMIDQLLDCFGYREYIKRIDC